MNIHIRKADPTDAPAAVPLIIDAIGDIAEQMTGEQQPEAVVRELIGLFKREDNRHSYLTTVVAEREGAVAGVMVLYSGESAVELDGNLEDWLSIKTKEDIEIPPEAHSDEYYIDTVCIHPDFRGQGIGTLLLAHAEEVALQAGFSKISLNVELEKEAAIRLYKRVGYRVSEPWMIYGEKFHHMLKSL
ncbi:GNAT family N-acetyltransferase [Paenisporosarcina indica]|uniref:GNAT family N-acetyltransferase n=1 Tax=Paenisporosarcina indica TaxID=650093 RepID=UPI00094F94F4|nr:GNAT family N-acetyltransferase [Paenisporosarcina indica]